MCFVIKVLAYTIPFKPYISNIIHIAGFYSDACGIIFMYTLHIDQVGGDNMKKQGVKVTEQDGKITLTFNPIEAQKSVRNFDPDNSAPKVHRTKKGKGSYSRKEKHKNRDGEDNTVSVFL